MSKDLTPKEVSRQLGVTHSAVTQWLRLGKLQGHRIGGRWRVTVAALEAFLLAGMHA
ncbi:helix-turn-helix domain-containing protein [Deinococcus wulumuqiensis]|nr:helix-turn-helix domain-containing protein [Deinococcus wulumuqiensis]QII19357.1 helix-turn-helix domain-containing protein [Deinococcus wulumuqiensis R12]